MPYTDQQIKDYAYALASKGASDEEIENFVRSASADRTVAPSAPTNVTKELEKKPVQQAGRLSDAQGVFLDSNYPVPPTDDAVRSAYMKAATPVASVAAKVGIPAAVSMFVPGGPLAVAEGGPLLTSAMMAGGGAAGEFAGQAIEGKRATRGDLARAAAMFAVPIPGVQEAPLLSFASVKNMLKGGISGGASALVGEYAARAADKGGIPSFEGYKQTFKDSVMPTLVNAATLGFSGRLLHNAKLQQEADAGRKVLAEIGISNPTLGDAMPRYAAMQDRVASVDPAMSAKVAQSRSPVTRAFYQTIGVIPSNESVAKELQPIIGQIDAAEAAYAKAQAEVLKANDAVQKARADTVLPITERSRILDEATAAQLNAVSAEARELMKAQVAADSVGTQTGHAESLRGVVGALFGARQTAAQNLMEKTGIAVEQAFIDRNQLLDAARSALGNRADSPAGKSILATIENSFKDKPSVAPKVGFPERGTAAQPMSIEEFRSLMNPTAEASNLSLNQFRALRDKISDDFVSSGVSDNVVSNAENLAAKAYKAMGDALIPQVETTYGKAAAENYKGFLKFWRDTSQLRDSKFGRAILRGEISDESVKGLANRLATGQVDEVKNFKDFVDIIRAQNKDVADLAMNTMSSAIRNSILEEASVNGTVNWKKVPQLLSSIMQKKDFPLPIESLRFGTPKDIQGWSAVINEFKPGELGPREIASVMESPVAQRVLSQGKDSKLGDTLRPILAAKAFNKRVLEAAVLDENGMTAKATRAYRDAVDLAKKAGMDADQAKAALAAAQSDPVVSAFRGKGSYKLTLDESAKMDSPGTLTDLIRNMQTPDAAAMMAKLRADNPQLYDLVKRRYLAGEFENFLTKDSTTEGQVWKLNPEKARAYFQPLPEFYEASTVKKMRSVLGDEDTQGVRNFILGLAKLDDQTRAAMMTNVPGRSIDEAIATARMAQTGSVSRGYAQQAYMGAIRKFIAEKKLNIASTMLLDDGWMNTLNRNAGDVGKALASIPIQKASALLNDADFVKDLRGKLPTAK